MQLNLFDIAKAYAGTEQLQNKALYEKVAPNIEDSAVPVGKSGQKHKLINRKIRWYQQTLKQLGLLEKSGKRAEWRLTSAGKQQFEVIGSGKVLLAFSTDLGIALWGDCNDVFSQLDGQAISLCLTSPPYPLRKPRAYGNPTESEYVDFICKAIEPIVRNLAVGGSICLNLGNDIFIAGSPARSLYRERLVLALHDRLGLYKMDELIWHNPCKPPGPMAWSSKTRQQLNVAWEPIYWFCLDPKRCGSNNGNYILNSLNSLQLLHSKSGAIYVQRHHQHLPVFKEVSKRATCSQIYWRTPLERFTILPSLQRFFAHSGTQSWGLLSLPRLQGWFHGSHRNHHGALAHPIR